MPGRSEWNPALMLQLSWSFKSGNMEETLETCEGRTEKASVVRHVLLEESVEDGGVKVARHVIDSESLKTYSVILPIFALLKLAA